MTDDRGGGTRRRRLSSLWSKASNDYQQLTGREFVVQCFHDACRRDQPAVFVVEGVPGSGKAQLVTHLRATYRGQDKARRGARVDTRIDFRDQSTEQEMALALMRAQLRRRKPLGRRVARPLWTLRFALMQGQLWTHDIKRGAVVPSGDERLRLLAWMLKTGAKAVQGDAVSLVSPPPRAGLVRWGRGAWTRFGSGAAADWVREYLEAIPDEDVVHDRDVLKALELRRGLSKAMAEDLAAATRRSRRRIGKVVLFFEGYERAEPSDRGLAQSWLVDFADDLRVAGANVLLVVSSREQRSWSARMEADPRHEVIDDGYRKGGDVEIHTLGELDEPARLRALVRAGIPAHQAAELAKLSRGYPLATSLLGWRYGSSSPRAVADQTVRDAMKKLSDELDAEQWMASFLSVMGSSIAKHLDDDLRRHARVAAALRTFDAALLERVMGDSFRDETFDRLLATPLIAPPRPSLLFDGREAYGIRPFIREFWQRGEPEPRAQRRWHERAREYFAEAARSGVDEPSLFALNVEELFYAFSAEPERSMERFAAAFLAEESARRFERCGMLAEMAREWRSHDAVWRVELETMAGSLYRHLGAHDVAVERLRAARDLAVELGERPDLAIRAGLGLAACLRLSGRHADAEQETAWVRERARGRPVASFQATWTASLIATDRGRIDDALAAAEEAAGALSAILARLDEHREEARALGLADMERKRGHLARHRAEIERRAGNYDHCHALIAEARETYRGNGEPEADALLDAVESHVLRLEGDHSGALTLAERASTKLRRCEHPTARAELKVLRCVAQARLAGSEPASARLPLAALAGVDGGRHPMSAAIGRHGLGELARLEGDFDAARSHLKVETELPSGTMERLYGRLTRVELEREVGDHERACELLEGLEDAAALATHPLLRFWVRLVAARVHARSSWHILGRRPQRLLAEAEQALESGRPIHDGHVAVRALADTRAAMGDHAEFERVHLLLP